MTRFEEKFISFSWKCPRESCWSALCPCSDSKTQVPSSPSLVILGLLVVLGIELVERPNSMEEACLPLKNGRGSTDLFMSHFVREWITSPTSNQRTVQGSCHACLDSHVKCSSIKLSGGEGIGGGCKPSPPLKSSALYSVEPWDPTLWQGEFRVCTQSPGAWHSTVHSQVHRKSWYYGPHFSHLSNAGKSIYHIKVVVKIKGSHSYLIC